MTIGASIAIGAFITIGASMTTGASVAAGMPKGSAGAVVLWSEFVRFTRVERSSRWS